ncbi:uncharacterized protein IL334_003592 [Kwoniella shivajii]|uniref:NAD(P)-binding protein n=1 Tax=Kwoniella shivajii TaxID=564305 RepID=A0ABZ1CY01_9TREE|nr:hypothetical protein IL334_003592 [Kwoniella shivajii]
MVESSYEQGLTLSPLKAIWEHFTGNFPVPQVNLEGRTVLVTGGNAGLGYASVLHYARSNASRIIIASRDLKRIQTSIEQVYRDVPTYKGKIDAMQVDLSSFDSVRTFCESVKADSGRLDIVLANAGIMNAKYAQTGDGYERVLQVNGLATGLMAVLLLPKLEETASLPVPEASKGMKPSITIVASDVHYFAIFPQKNATGSLIEALNDPTQFENMSERYNMSKVLSVFIAREISKLPSVTSGKVTVTSVNPGLCKSEFRADMGPVLAKIMNWIAWTSEKGARNFLYASTQNCSPGSYISGCREQPVSTFVASHKGRETQEKYWKESMDIWRKVAPETNDVL